MATHTKTSSKKKLVYTQGPDGVFRLKKDNTEKPKKTTEGYYNELLDCSYKISEEKEEEIKTVPEDPSTVTPYPSAVATLNPNAVKTVLPENVSDNSENGTSRPQDGNFISNFIRSKIMVDFHAPSFCCGVLMCLILSQSQQLLGKYAVIAFDAAKVGLLWTAVLGGLGWYFGVINTQDTASLLQLYTQKVNSLRGTPSIQEIPVNNQPRIPSPPSRAAITSPTGISNGAINQSMPELHKPESRPPIAERRNTLSRITPFYNTHTKDNLIDRRNSNVNVGNNNKLVNPPRPIPKKAVSHEERRNSSSSMETFKSVPSSIGTAQHSQKSIDKELPRQPPRIDELPFVNEIKLLSEYEVEDFDFSADSMDMKRLNSVLSKKSLLGTRNNYKKFIANVPTQTE